MRKVISCLSALALSFGLLSAPAAAAPGSNPPPLIAGQLPGTATNDNAAAGNVGEYLTASAAAVSLTTTQAKTCTSFALTPGDWEISSVVEVAGGAGTSQTLVETSISTVTNTIQTAVGQFTGDVGVTKTTPDNTYSISGYRVSLAAGATYFLVVLSNFTVSTQAANCTIRARRMR